MWSLRVNLIENFIFYIYIITMAFEAFNNLTYFGKDIP